MKRFELYFTDLIKGHHKGLIPFILRSILHFFSLIYKIIVSMRNWAFDQGLFGSYYPPVPLVISVGNIVAGGTGKTPITLMLAREFYDQFLIAILSRGYRSSAENFCDPIVLCSGNGPVHPPSYCGDEPYLIAENLPKSIVIVGKNRHKSSDVAARAGAQIIFLDDGMQHRNLARDFDIVVIDARDPKGQGYFLPRGFLREGISSLRRAHLVILNHIQDKDHYVQIKKELSSYTHASFIGMQMKVEEILMLDGSAIPSIANLKVGICCGIANPDSFKKTVESLGANVVETYIIPDHTSFDNKLLLEFSSLCQKKECDILLCTEKDKVKLPTNLNLALPIAWLRMKLGVVEGADEWRNFINKAKIDLS